MNSKVSYREINKHQRRDARIFLRDFQAMFKWNSGDSYLDIGCGPGDVTKDIIWPLLPRDISGYTCLDISARQLECCREEMIGRDCIFAQIDVGKRQDLRSLGQFTHAISLMCLHWIPNVKIALENIWDVLETNGDFFCSFVSECPNRKINYQMVESEKWREYFQGIEGSCEPYWRSADPVALLKEQLAEVGFKDVVVEVREILYEWETPQDFLNYFLTFSEAFMKHVPEDRREDFLQDQVELAVELNVIVSRRNWAKPVDPYRILVGFARKQPK